MYFATSISHLPISRFISCSTMLQRYVVFLKLPNNSEKNSRRAISRTLLLLIISREDIVFSQEYNVSQMAQMAQIFSLRAIRLYTNLRDLRNLREIKTNAFLREIKTNAFLREIKIHGYSEKLKSPAAVKLQGKLLSVICKSDFFKQLAFKIPNSVL